MGKDENAKHMTEKNIYYILKSSIRVFGTRLLGKDFSHIDQSVIKAVRMVSFDVFDTLIIRPGIKQPTDVFDMLHPNDSDFKKKRTEAEKNVRALAERKGIEDVKLTDIYKTIYLNDPEMAKSAERIEIVTELDVCKANPSALVFFNSIRSGEYGDKRIIITSDMYLSKETIAMILNNCGYDLDGIHVYVSSEYKMTKRSGSMYAEILKDEGMDARDVIHIGDNLMSDYVMPRSLGMKAFLYSSSDPKNGGR